MTEVKLIDTTDDGEIIYSIKTDNKEKIMPVDIDNILKTMDIIVKNDFKKSLTYIKYKDKNFYVSHSYDCREYADNIINGLRENNVKNLKIEIEEKSNKSEKTDITGIFEARCSKCGFCTVPYYSLSKIKENYPTNICPDCNRESLKILGRNSKNGWDTLQ